MTELLFQKCFTYTGDITEAQVDAIVNAANSSLLGGGGVDGAIHRAAGPTLLDACRKLRHASYRDGLPPGEAAATTAGKLPARYVIHTVGPHWQGGGRGEEKLLRSAYINSLHIAEQLGCRSIAFPAISTGVYGYPKEQADLVVWDVLQTYYAEHDHQLRISLVFFTEQDEQLFHTTINRVRNHSCH